MEPISPSVWRRARRNTARSVSAVRIAKGEYQGCPPRVVRGAARHPSIASSENHTVRLPRWRKLASYSRQFITFRFCLGMWWRRSWFSLNGKVGIRRSEKGQSSYVGPARSATGRIHATTPRGIALSFVREFDLQCQLGLRFTVSGKAQGAPEEVTVAVAFLDLSARYSGLRR